MNGAKKIFYIEFSFDIRLALAIDASMQSLPKFCVSNILRQQAFICKHNFKILTIKSVLGVYCLDISQTLLCILQWKQRRPVDKNSPCIRTEEGYCDIKYTKSTFSISSGSSEEGDDCTEDYIIIPDNGRNNNRYCGSGLSNIVSKFRDNNNHGFVRLPCMG